MKFKFNLLSTNEDQVHKQLLVGERAFHPNPGCHPPPLVLPSPESDIQYVRVKLVRFDNKQYHLERLVCS